MITLAVEPGWNTFCTGMSVAWVASVMVAGSNVGHCAMASTSPVCGWMITTVQLLALVFLTWLGARLLGRVLQRRDDGEPQAAAVHHRLVAAARERDLLAVGADLHLLAARLAGQQRVVLLLQAGPALRMTPLRLPVKPMMLAATLPSG